MGTPLSWRLKHHIRYILSRRYRKSYKAWAWYTELTDKEKKENMALYRMYIQERLRLSDKEKKEKNKERKQDEIHG